MFKRLFENWLAKRLRASDTTRLAQHNIYIVPTRAGLAFALTLLLMLVAAINYQLNLGYVLTFLLAGAGGISMHLTHGTLRGLTLHLKPPQPVFAGERALLEIVLTNPGRERNAIAVQFHQRDTPGARFAWCDVPAHGQATVRLAFAPARRGWHDLPLLSVETGFPFGLFRAWTVWRPASRVLAWPRPEQPVPPLPPAVPVAGNSAARVRSIGSELDGVRAWRRGDPLRLLVWKKMARSGQLVSRETATPGARQLWLDWPTTAGRDPEQRLARLAAWVQAAERDGVVWGLRLPGHELPPASGDTHRRAALDLLATF